MGTEHELKADLVLEGGGVKGIALAGAISVLMDAGYTFPRVAGTSAGSIVGALVAAGFSAKEITETVSTVEYSRFQDGRGWDDLWVGKLGDLLVHDGVYRGEYLRTWLTGKLEEKGKRTFADLRYVDPDGREVPANRAYTLVVNVSDITAGRLRQLPWDYHDAFSMDADATPIADAVRCSMSIPLFYQPVKLKRGDGSGESWIVDGGMLSNFPVDLFDAPPGTVPRWPTFGAKLSGRPEAGSSAVANDVHNLRSEVLAMVDTLTGFYDRIHINDPSVTARTIFIDTGFVSATKFNLSPEERDRLFVNGQEAATRFLEGDATHPKWDFSEYVATYRS